MKNKLSFSRQAYKNPLAHMEELEREHSAEEDKLFCTKIAFSTPSPGDYPSILHNPYLAANNEAADFDQNSDTQVQGEQEEKKLPKFPIVKSDKYRINQIQETVRRLHRYIWDNKTKIWGDAIPKDPVEMLDVKIAAKIAGFDYQELGGIGIHQTSAGDSEIAGLIDESNRTISISHQQKMKVRRFTAAHEIGHAMLHEFHGTMHRDRASEIMGPKRDPREKEADQFATLFLMPAKLVEKRFLETFYAKPFVLTNETVFALGFSNAKEFLHKYPTRRDLAKLLASTERFNHTNIQSLADQFGVSTKAMAIRLEELNLVE